MVAIPPLTISSLNNAQFNPVSNGLFPLQSHITKISIPIPIAIKIKNTPDKSNAARRIGNMNEIKKIRNPHSEYCSQYKILIIRVVIFLTIAAQ